jgi:hypothetical protein
LGLQTDTTPVLKNPFTKAKASLSLRKSKIQLLLGYAAFRASRYILNGSQPLTDIVAGTTASFQSGSLQT